MSSTTNTSRPSLARSKTMPAFRRALSMPSVEKSLASLRASSNKGLRRMSSFCKTSSASTISPSTSTESMPVFTTPDYTQPKASCPPPSPSISPLTRPGFKRAMTMPAPVGALRSTTLSKLPALKKACQWPARKSSVDSVASVASSASISTTSTRRRSSSISSFHSTEERVTLGLRLRAFPSTLLGLFTSIMAVILISILPAMAASTPKRKPAPRSYEREIVLTDEQERNPPKLRKSTTTSRLSRRIAKVYRRTLRRVARAHRASTTSEALAVLCAPTPKRVHAATPAPVKPKMLVTEIPLVVYSSLIALPLPKGPAPAVLPAPKARKLTLLPTVQEESVDNALCAGW